MQTYNNHHYFLLLSISDSSLYFLLLSLTPLFLYYSWAAIAVAIIVIWCSLVLSKLNGIYVIPAQ